MKRPMKITYKFDDSDYRKCTHLLSHRYRIDYWGRLMHKKTDRPMIFEVFGVPHKGKARFKCLSKDIHDYRKCNWLLC